MRAVEPHWNALMMLFGDCGSDDNIDYEQEFFDPFETCVHDGWVHEIPPSVEESFEYEFNSYMDANRKCDPSWSAFIQKYYASDTDTASVTMNVGKSPRLLTFEPQSLIQPARHNSNATPSSCASNKLEVVAKLPSPLLDRYLLRRPPKKPKF
ncbi:UNVERIFIED_CONTAM: hypothetical protein Sradi_6463400 [Sesamum radiatum]|uniref:Uncharacterized protein n=1 Tax=Sesamum radiatum TaxID=300843 RepID=A0AAW2K5G0_SESRA